MNTPSIKDVELYVSNTTTLWGFEAPQPDKEQWFIDAEGDKLCLMNDEYHCSTGPAIITSEGDKWWYQYGTLNRTDGPAVEFATGAKQYWIDDVMYTEYQFYARQKVGQKTSKVSTSEIVTFIKEYVKSRNDNTVDEGNLLRKAEDIVNRIKG